MLAAGQADAFATDDVLLYGLVAARAAQATMAVVGDFITYEPYGIMFRRDDPQMAAGRESRLPHHGATARARRHLPALVPAADADRRACSTCP